MYYINLANPLNKRIRFDKQRKIADEIGIHQQTLSKILNARQGTQKTTAYCIVKAFDKDAEIEDYFVREEE